MTSGHDAETEYLEVNRCDDKRKKKRGRQRASINRVSASSVEAVTNFLEMKGLETLSSVS